MLGNIVTKPSSIAARAREAATRGASNDFFAGCISGAGGGAAPGRGAGAPQKRAVYIHIKSCTNPAELPETARHSAARPHAMGGGASRAAALQPDEVSPHQAPPSFVLLIAAGRVVPDERDGPYMPDSFHANLIGANRGYRSREGRLEYIFTSKTNMARQKSWGTIDFEGKNAVDLEYMFTLGEINGKGVDLAVLRPVVIEAQRATKTGYSKTFETARSKPGAAEAYERIAALPERRGKTRQSGGEQLDLVGLYKSALGAVGELWQFGQKAIRASGEAGVAASWSIKKARTQRSYRSTHPNPIVGIPLSLTRTRFRTRTRTRTLTLSLTSHM